MEYSIQLFYNIKLDSAVLILRYKYFIQFINAIEGFSTEIK
jgi:hypothetical protein